MPFGGIKKGRELVQIRIINLLKYHTSIAKNKSIKILTFSKEAPLFFCELKIKQ